MTPELVSAFFGGMVLLIGALGAVYVQIRAAHRAVVETKDVVKQTKAELVAVDEAHGRKLDDIVTLVNGPYGVLLRKVAELEQQIAAVSGRSADQAASVRAVDATVEHAGRLTGIAEAAAARVEEKNDARIAREKDRA